jgi:hypothetical protein
MASHLTDPAAAFDTRGVGLATIAFEGDTVRFGMTDSTRARLKLTCAVAGLLSGVLLVLLIAPIVNPQAEEWLDAILERYRLLGMLYRALWFLALGTVGATAIGAGQLLYAELLVIDLSRKTLVRQRLCGWLRTDISRDQLIAVQLRLEWDKEQSKTVPQCRLQFAHESAAFSVGSAPLTNSGDALLLAQFAEWLSTVFSKPLTLDRAPAMVGKPVTGSAAFMEIIARAADDPESGTAEA